MARRAMGQRKAAGDLDRADRVRRAERPHRDDHAAAERPRRDARNGRRIHRHVAAEADMTDLQPLFDQRRLEGKGAADNEGDEVVAPEFRDVGHFLDRSEEHTSELQSLMRISYAVFCLKKKKITPRYTT